MAGPIAASPRRAGGRPATTVKEIGVERAPPIGRMTKVGAPWPPTPRTSRSITTAAAPWPEPALIRLASSGVTLRPVRAPGSGVTPASHVTPASSGWARAFVMSWSMLRVAVTPITATTAPRRAGTTGTRDRPTPGWKAIDAPNPRLRGARRRNAARTVELRYSTDPYARCSARRPRRNAAASTPTIVTATPGPSTDQSKWVPTLGSMRRPRPTGNRDERPTATAKAVTPAATAAMTWDSPVAIPRSPRVMPNERKVCASSPIVEADRPSACETRIPPARATAPARRSRAVRSTASVVVIRRLSAWRSRTGAPPKSEPASRRSAPMSAAPWRRATSAFCSRNTSFPYFAMKAGDTRTWPSVTKRNSWSSRATPTTCMVTFGPVGCPVVSV